MEKRSPLKSTLHRSGRTCVDVYEQRQLCVTGKIGLSVHTQSRMGAESALGHRDAAYRIRR